MVLFVSDIKLGFLIWNDLDVLNIGLLFKKKDDKYYKDVLMWMVDSEKAEDYMDSNR